MQKESALGSQQSTVTKLVVQQPQFLPWAGLWFKALSADIYVIYAGVKFDQGDHQHRVTINGHWVTLSVEKGQRNALIKDVKLASDEGVRKIALTIRQAVMTKKHRYRDRLDDVVSVLEKWNGEWMLDLNNALFVELGNVLGIRPQLFVDVESRDEAKIEKLDVCVRRYAGQGPFIYLAGRAGLDYMGYDSLKSPVETRFQLMKPSVSPDSVLQLIATEDDPLAVIRSCALWEAKEGLFYEYDNATQHPDPRAAL
jgi:WbqC-like protein family